jgi:hypothetical protein
VISELQLQRLENCIFTRQRGTAPIGGDQCRGGFQTLPCGHLRDNETADGQHKMGRVIAGRNLENGGIGFFVVVVVVRRKR